MAADFNSQFSYFKYNCQLGRIYIIQWHKYKQTNFTHQSYEYFSGRFDDFSRHNLNTGFN